MSGDELAAAEPAVAPPLSKAALLGRRIGEADCVVKGLGTIRIRGLSRAEVLEIRKLDDTAAWDRRMCSLGMVAPTLTEDEVATWQANSGPGEIEAVTRAIAEMSGTEAGSAKAAYRLFRG